MRHYYVDPNTQIADPRAWIGGQYVSAADPLPNGKSGFNAGHLPEFDLYVAIEDATRPAQYERWMDPRYALAFEGTIGDEAARVRETSQIEQITIGELYDTKRQDVFDYDQAVRYNAADTSLATNWWLIITRDLRFEIDGIQGNWLQRQIDGQGWPAGLNAPWVGIFNASTGDSRRVQVTTAANWNTLYLEKTLHDQATGNATDASVTALDAAYDDGNGIWQDVADHDPQDPAWGYPPTTTL